MQQKLQKKQQEACENITEMNQVILSSKSESFKHKTSITGNTYHGDDDADKVGKNETEVVILLKH